jgi:hypothetical protein
MSNRNLIDFKKLLSTFLKFILRLPTRETLFLKLIESVFPALENTSFLNISFKNLYKLKFLYLLMI